MVLMGAGASMPHLPGTEELTRRLVAWPGFLEPIGPMNPSRPTRDCYVLDTGYRGSMQRTTSAGVVAFSWSVQSDVCFEDANCLFPRDLVRGSRHSAKYAVCK